MSINGRESARINGREPPLGQYVEDADYVIFKEEGVVKAKDGSDGTIAFTGGSVIQKTIDATTGGGRIVITETVEETGIVIDDRLTLEGCGSALGVYGHPYIDTSGGDGIKITVEGVTLRDLVISGDKTGGYGILVEGCHSGVLDNVHIIEKGGNGLEFLGGAVGNVMDWRCDVKVWNVGGNGIFIHLTSNNGFFNENLFLRSSVHSVDGNSVVIDGDGVSAPVKGNVFLGLYTEDEGGDYGLEVVGDTIFQQNLFTGFGCDDKGIKCLSKNAEKNRLILHNMGRPKDVDLLGFEEFQTNTTFYQTPDQNYRDVRV